MSIPRNQSGEPRPEKIEQEPVGNPSEEEVEQEEDLDE